MQRWQRLLRHLFQTHLGARRCFTTAVLDRIEAAVQVAEASHCGEIEVVIENDLDIHSILAGKTPRQRALEIFGAARVWDTESNNGVLIYVLFADRAVEIIADRGFNDLVRAEEWSAVCRAMEQAFREARWEQGAIAGVDGVAGLIARHFPGSGRAGNELPDRPILL